MGQVLRFSQKADRASAPVCVLRVRRFPAQSTQYLEAEIPLEHLPVPDPRQWIEVVETPLKMAFAPFEGSHVSIGVDNVVVYIHVFLDEDLDDNEIVENGMCLRQFLEERNIHIHYDYTIYA